MLHAFLTFAQAVVEEEEPSQTAFHVAGTLLALWAVVISFVGIRRHADWPGEGSGRGIMGISALLVLATMATAVITG